MDRVVRLVTRKPMLGEPFGEPTRKSLINNDNGGPGGCLENKQNQLVSERWDRAAFKSVPMLSDVFVPLAAFVPASSPYKHLAQFAVDEGNRISIASSKWKGAVTQ